MLIECVIIFIVSFWGILKTVFLLFTKVTGLNTMIGLLKILKYHVKGKEVFILYNETLMIFKWKNIIRNTAQF